MEVHKHIKAHIEKGLSDEEIKAKLYSQGHDVISVGEAFGAIRGKVKDIKNEPDEHIVEKVFSVFEKNPYILTIINVLISSVILGYIMSRQLNSPFLSNAFAIFIIAIIFVSIRILAITLIFCLLGSEDKGLGIFDYVRRANIVAAFDFIPLIGNYITWIIISNWLGGYWHYRAWKYYAAIYISDIFVTLLTFAMVVNLRILI